MAKSRDHPFFDAIKKWSTADFALYLARAIRLLAQWQGAADDKSRRRLTVLAVRELNPLYVGTNDTLRGALEAALREVHNIDPLRVPNAALYLLRQSENPITLEELAELIWLLVNTGFSDGEPLAYVANDWIRINCRKMDTSSAYEALMYLVGNTAIRPATIPFLSKVESEGAATPIVVEAALRVVSKGSPSDLPWILKTYGRVIETDNSILPRDIQDVILDLISRSNLQILLKTLICLDPEENSKLFKSIFCVIENAAPLYICYVGKVTANSTSHKLKVFCHGFAAEDLSDLFHLTVGHGREKVWTDALQTVVGAAIVSNPDKSILDVPNIVVNIVANMHRNGEKVGE